MHSIRRVHCFSGLLLALCAGCGGSSLVEPPLAPVKGRITVDGAPAPGLQVSFDRVAGQAAGEQDSGAMATAVTDADGKYELLYKGTPGAPVGSHNVRIMRLEGDVTAPPGPPIPPEYNISTRVTADVKAGADNTFDYDVKTK